MEILFENKEICSNCGSACCKKCGCDYSTDNFDTINIDSLQKRLEEGYISIVSFQDFKKVSNSKIINRPFLYLRARNINRPIVDLLSMKTTCMSLQENGCRWSLQERPKGGVNLIPKENKDCYPLKSPTEIIKGWEKYQVLLERLVKRLTGNTVPVQLKLDIEKLFIDILSSNFDGIAREEILDILNTSILLQKVYNEEYESALKKIEVKKVYQKK